MAIDSIHLEKMVSQCISSAHTPKHVGGGHNDMDIVYNDTDSNARVGIDITGVSAKKGSVYSGEKSLIQAFVIGDKPLDQIFAENNDVEAVSIYRQLLLDKHNRVLTTANRHLLMVFIATDDQLWITCYNYHITDTTVANMVSRGFSKQHKSIQIDGIIDPQYGTTRLNSSKKRIEL